jgi:16S rRNA (cytosine1402-N4)-methyltransferase
MNALLFERPIWFATDRLAFEEEAHEMEDFIYHRPVLAAEAIELLQPRPGGLIVDATCGGGGHSEAILRAGADVLGLDQDPDAIQHAGDRLSEFGGRVTLAKQHREADKILDELGIARIGGALRYRRFVPPTRRCGRGFSLMRNGPLDMRMDLGAISPSML